MFKKAKSKLAKLVKVAEVVAEKKSVDVEVLVMEKLVWYSQVEVDLDSKEE